MAAVESNLERIEEFFQSPSYLRCVELSTTFNSRLARERKLRLPFLDLQTGIAQRHCSLNVSSKQRMPGLREGQLYTFPAQRWRKNKRQYLSQTPHDSLVHPVTTTNSTTTTQGNTSGGFLVVQNDDNSNSNASFLLDKFQVQQPDGALDGDTNSRDTNNNAKEDEMMIKDWYYDELDNDFDDEYSEPKSPDEEYDPRYGTKKRSKKVSKKETKSKKAAATVSFGNFDFGSSPSAAAGSKGAGRGRSSTKDASSTPRKTPGRKASGKNKKFTDPPSFETAAVSFPSDW